jgi:hypothetical protein
VEDTELTVADERAYTSYAEAARHKDNQQISVTYPGRHTPGESTPDEPRTDDDPTDAAPGREREPEPR